MTGHWGKIYGKKASLGELTVNFPAFAPGGPGRRTLTLTTLRAGAFRLHKMRPYAVRSRNAKFRASAKLKLLGHALECLGYAQANGFLDHGLGRPRKRCAASRPLSGSGRM